MASAIYLRKSRAEEDILDALQRHRDTLLEFAEKNGITVIKIYEEVVSGENLYMRPQMLKLLEDIERGAYDSVLCMDIDRLGRGNMTSQGIILDTFKNAGCVIITPRRVYDLNNELDEEYTEFETFLARREYKIITRRMRRGIVKSVQSGGHIGEVPFGYKRSFAEKLPTLEVDAEKAEFVSMAFDMYVNGGLGCQLIADAFTNAGLKPKKSDGKWARSTIRKILKNPVYTGEICWNKFRSVRKKKTDEKNTQIPNNKSEWIVVKNAHPAIIDAETFAHAQEIMESRAHSAYFTGEFINPLAGLIYCSACGGLMQRQHLKSREKFPRLYCRTKGCSRGVRLEYVETAVTEALNSVLSGFSGKLKSTVPMDNSKIIQRYSLELDKSRLQKDKLHDLLEQGVYSPEVFAERETKLLALEAELRALIAGLKKEPGDYQNTCRPGEIKLSAEYFSQLGDPNQKNAILKALVKKIIFTRGKDYPKNKFDLTIILKGL